MPLTVQVTRNPYGSSIIFPMAPVPVDPVPTALISGEKGRIVASSLAVVQVDVWVIWKKKTVAYDSSLVNDEIFDPATVVNAPYPPDGEKIGLRWEIDYPSLTPVLLEVFVTCIGGRGLVQIEVLALPRGDPPPKLPPDDLVGTSYHAGTITC